MVELFWLAFLLIFTVMYCLGYFLAEDAFWFLLADEDDPWDVSMSGLVALGVFLISPILGVMCLLWHGIQWLGHFGALVFGFYD